MKPEDQEFTSVATLDPGPDKVIGPGHDYGSVTDEIGGVVFRPFLKTPRQMFIGFAFAFLLVNLLMIAVTWLFVRGVGVWGIDMPVAWGFAIVNFVWWIGIGHAGTLISAILLLLKQDWRTSINRFSEAMTLFAVACAGMFPILHLGRPWLAYWLLPYPEHDVDVAAAAEPADLGRVRGIDLRHGFPAVLVHGLDSGFRDDARQGRQPDCAEKYSACSPWAGVTPQSIGRDIRKPTCC